jgi:hypothetical protein
MRKMVWLMATVGLLGVGAKPAHAQVLHPVEFTTDFKFIAGNATFPAGTYMIRPVENELDLVEIVGPTVAAFVEVSPQRVKRKEPAKDEIVFNKYGQAVEVLNQLWDAVDNFGVQVVQARAELRNEKKYGRPTQHAVPSKRSK